MPYTIQDIKFFVRETKPARFRSALGKKGQSGNPAQRVTSPLCHVGMTVRKTGGDVSFGCSADRLSVRWLDKRPGRSKGLKLRELVSLIELAGRIYLRRPTFESPFEQWLTCHRSIMRSGRQRNQEDLTAAFASALLERAMLDAVCRLHAASFIEMVAEDRFGFRPGGLHAELRNVEASDFLRPLDTRIAVRHTVGLLDPLNDDDWPSDQRLNDGLPETLEECIRDYGIRYFKVKISGDPAADLQRLTRIWEILPHGLVPVITLDANESYDDLGKFQTFVKRLEREQLGLFQHIAYIEQPLPRHLALAPQAEKAIRQVGAIKPVIIDESDATLDAFRRARGLGYAGTSHKNCKGVFKSFANRALLNVFAAKDPNVVISAEDLQNLPIVPLHQDFVMVAVLGLRHCERNGHHYNSGLSMLSEIDKASVARWHGDLYKQRGDEWFLHIDHGNVETASLHAVGFGVRDEPDWDSMMDMNRWVKTRYPA